MLNRIIEYSTVCVEKYIGRLTNQIFYFVMLLLYKNIFVVLKFGGEFRK